MGQAATATYSANIPNRLVACRLPMPRTDAHAASCFACGLDLPFSQF
ncbi:MAG: hypothetical protein KDB73_16200 [Planctomycetes bacterium]|nr:hypothetical protein [Planctomycetota bacterium]